MLYTRRPSQGLVSGCVVERSGAAPDAEENRWKVTGITSVTWPSVRAGRPSGRRVVIGQPRPRVLEVCGQGLGDCVGQRRGCVPVVQAFGSVHVAGGRPGRWGVGGEEGVGPRPVCWWWPVDGWGWCM